MGPSYWFFYTLLSLAIELMNTLISIQEILLFFSFIEFYSEQSWSDDNKTQNEKIMQLAIA